MDTPDEDHWNHDARWLRRVQRSAALIDCAHDRERFARVACRNRARWLANGQPNTDATWQAMRDRTDELLRDLRNMGVL